MSFKGLEGNQSNCRAEIIKKAARIPMEFTVGYALITTNKEEFERVKRLMLKSSFNICYIKY